MLYLIKLVTTALELSYLAGETNVRVEWLKSAAVQGLRWSTSGKTDWAVVGGESK
jgi:hypothetical protein